MSAVVGRERELDTLRRFLDGEEQAARTLVLEGEAGIGKSTLWRASVELAREHGYRVLECRGDRSETQVSFAAIRDLVGDAFDEVAEALPTPQRHALAVILLLEQAAGAPPDVGTTAAAFLTRLAPPALSGSFLGRVH